MCVCDYRCSKKNNWKIVPPIFLNLRHSSEAYLEPSGTSTMRLFLLKKGDHWKPLTKRNLRHRSSSGFYMYLCSHMFFLVPMLRKIISFWKHLNISKDILYLKFRFYSIIFLYFYESMPWKQNKNTPSGCSGNNISC